MLTKLCALMKAGTNAQIHLSNLQKLMYASRTFKSGSKALKVLLRCICVLRRTAMTLQGSFLLAPESVYILLSRSQKPAVTRVSSPTNLLSIKRALNVSLCTWKCLYLYCIQRPSVMSKYFYVSSSSRWSNLESSLGEPICWNQHWNIFCWKSPPFCRSRLWSIAVWGVRTSNLWRGLFIQLGTRRRHIWPLWYCWHWPPYGHNLILPDCSLWCFFLQLKEYFLHQFLYWIIAWCQHAQMF